MKPQRLRVPRRGDVPSRAQSPVLILEPPVHLRPGLDTVLTRDGEEPVQLGDGGGRCGREPRRQRAANFGGDLSSRTVHGAREVPRDAVERRRVVPVDDGRAVALDELHDRGGRGGGEVPGRGFYHAALEEPSVPRRRRRFRIHGRVTRRVIRDAEPDKVERRGHGERRERQLGREAGGLRELGVTRGEVVEEGGRRRERPDARPGIVVVLVPLRESPAPGARELVALAVRRTQPRPANLAHVLLLVPARDDAEVPRRRVRKGEQVPGPLRRDQPPGAHAARVVPPARRPRVDGRQE